MPNTDWIDARNHMFLDPTVAYLNAGSFGPLPRCVFDRVTSFRRNIAEEPMDFLLRRLPPLLWNARERLADFLGTDAHRLVFTTNVTVAVNIVASSLSLHAPGEILLTDYEYQTMHWCWERTARLSGLILRTFQLPTLAVDPGEIIEAAISSMNSRTRLFFFSHVISSTGMILPVQELCTEARKRGIITVVDGAHAPAFIDINLSRIPCDFYVGNGHKWLLAPTGTGFLYLGSENENRLQPMHVSWGYKLPVGNQSLDSRDQFGSTPRLRMIESEGTRDITPWLTVPEAIDFQSMLGKDKVYLRMRELTDYIRQRLVGLRGLKLATPKHPDMYGAITSFRLLDGTDTVMLRSSLWEKFRIEASIIERSDQLLIRASTHFYNTEAEIELLAKALWELL